MLFKGPKDSKLCIFWLHWHFFGLFYIYSIAFLTPLRPYLLPKIIFFENISYLIMIAFENIWRLYLRVFMTIFQKYSKGPMIYLEKGPILKQWHYNYVCGSPYNPNIEVKFKDILLIFVFEIAREPLKLEHFHSQFWNPRRLARLFHRKFSE